LTKTVEAKTPLVWARAACAALMEKYPAAVELPPARRWHYHQGVFLCGMEQLWERTREAKYDEYIRAYVDGLVDPFGNFPYARDELDAIQPGLLLFRLDDGSPNGKYRIAARKLRGLFDTLHRTAEGGFWHKDKYPYQMWLDGLYMGGVFALKYAAAHGEPELRKLVLHQERLMRIHMKDEASGLLYHAWDEKRAAAWAHPDTGCSPEFWARSIGWYVLALAEFLELLPEEEPGREEIAASLQDVLHALIRYQDLRTGLWHQVVDKGGLSDNWLETSGTSLFVYAMAKAVRLGIAGADVITSAKAGYQGLIDTIRVDGEGRFELPLICIGTSAGDYENYVTRPTSTNDLHGVGAFVMACVAMHDMLR